MSSSSPSHEQELSTSPSQGVTASFQTQDPPSGEPNPPPNNPTTPCPSSPSSLPIDINIDTYFSLLTPSQQTALQSRRYPIMVLNNSDGTPTIFGEMTPAERLEYRLIQIERYEAIIASKTEEERRRGLMERRARMERQTEQERAESLERQAERARERKENVVAQREGLEKVRGRVRERVEKAQREGRWTGEEGG